MKKLLLFLLASIFILNKSGAQKLLYSYDSVLQHLDATSEPPADWFEPGFNDSAWTTDTAAIGFGEYLYPADSNAKSIYARFNFNIANKSAVKALNLFIDYDDGYIAYLNGHEIVRVNVDKYIEFPSFDALASRSHEAELIRDYTMPVEGVYLDSMLLDSCLVVGKNIIAVHVLNDSADGSDMAFIPLLWDITNAPYNIYELSGLYKGLIDFDSTNLPLVIINTNEFGIPVSMDAPRVKAFMGVVDNGPDAYNHTDDEFNVYNGAIDIEIRGRTSNYFPKSPFRFELKDPDGGDTSVILLGMPKDEDWILYGPLTDKSMIRNNLVYELGSKLGHYQPRSKFCELILNGQAVGLYTLTENIKRSKDRVNVASLKNTDIRGVDVTGGYIFKYDKDNTIKRTMVYPKEDSIQPEQIAYFNNYMKSYDSIFTTNKFINPGFRKYLDDTTLVDFLIMNEISKNCDAYLYSTYCYKDREDRDNRVKFGPLWDFDFAFGNTRWQNGHLTAGWQWDETQNQRLGIRRLLQDTVLVNFLQDRWFTLRESILSDEYIFENIDSMVNYINEVRVRNYKIWPIIDKPLYWANYAYVVPTYDDEIATLKNWIATRTAWMDENMDKLEGRYPLKVYSSIETYAEVNSIDCYVYPNPFADQLTLEINSDEPSEINIEISNILGQQSYFSDLGTITSEKFSLVGEQFSEMPTGVYFLRIYTNNKLNKTIKIIKN
jgi:hypothetical protein